MKTSITKSIFGLLACIVLVSCNNTETLQTYFVDNQETPDFISADIPTSIVTLDETTLSDDQKEAYNSIKSLNFLGFKLSDTNEAVYQAELLKVEGILSNEKYNELIELNDRAANINIMYLGEDDVADEFIVFTSSKEMGFGIVRVLGNQMRPEKMVTLIDALKDADVDKSQFESIANFFK